MPSEKVQQALSLAFSVSNTDNKQSLLALERSMSDIEQTDFIIELTAMFSHTTASRLQSYPAFSNLSRQEIANKIISLSRNFSSHNSSDSEAVVQIALKLQQTFQELDWVQLINTDPPTQSIH